MTTSQTTSQTTSRTAEYKGRKYRLAFCGQTKFGKRAKLVYFDGSKEFWVDASAITSIESASRSPRSYSLGPRTGCSCGSRENGSQPTDCARCRFDQDDN